ncbi:MAG: glucan biosynthesis protein [Bdellovibrio bacteriovorus]
MMSRILGLVSLGLVLAMSGGVRAGDDPALVEPPAAAGTPGEFTFAAVVRRAADLAREAYQPDRPALPDYLANLDYDKHRDIRFRPDQSLWRAEGLPFQVQFFPRGFLFEDRVKVNVIEGGQAIPVDFQHDFFDYGKNQVPEVMPPDLGFAGLRLMYPINRDDYFDEVGVFLGASYGRAVAQGRNYGITARGLAIDTGLPSREEFPVFREFWIRKPAADATEIELYALMDSESLTGAYRFNIRPGTETVIDVKARLFFRREVQKLGVAPLTSMYFHGESTDRFMDDFRPEVHDSDGVLIETAYGERIWRPLANPIGLRISNFVVESPRSFALLQRDRDFSHYEDLEAHYHNRPSLVVEPQGEWGKGMVELVEIPSNAERYDNIAVFWVPERRTAAGQEREFAYRLRFAKDPEAGLLGGRALATRIGAGGTDILDPNVRKFVVDFAGANLADLDPETQVEAVVTTTSGTLSPPVTQYNPETHGWRLFFELTPDGRTPADLRAFLRHGEDVLSETWSFRWVKE